jgi:AcrR family transcriptional regulator
VDGGQPARNGSDERTQVVLKAALRLLNTMPYENIVVEDIAAAAGMSRPLLYHYFGGKEQIMAATLRWCGNRMLAKLQRAACRAGADWLRTGLGVYLDFATDRTLSSITLVRRAYLPDAVETVRWEVRGRIFRDVADRLAPNGVSPVLRSLIWGWFGQVESMCHDWQSHPEPDRRVLEALLYDLLLATLATGAAHDAVTANAWRMVGGG